MSCAYQAPWRRTATCMSAAMPRDLVKATKSVPVVSSNSTETEPSRS